LEEIESKNFQDDQELEQEIQEAIEKENSISAIAKNIQVTVDHGKATLIGVVPSEQERMTIGDKAAAFVGFGKVINELEIEEGLQ
jgi:osmotically-inducible protein OsmY